MSHEISGIQDRLTKQAEEKLKDRIKVAFAATEKAIGQCSYETALLAPPPRQSKYTTAELVQALKNAIYTHDRADAVNLEIRDFMQKVVDVQSQIDEIKEQIAS